MNLENEKVKFKKTFRGYSPEEVDEYVESTSKDIEALRAEVADLYKKLAEANREVEKYHREEAVRGDIIKEAKQDADDIMKNAKGRAARVIIRTSRQCNRIVADMVSQVEEQKGIYESTKREVLKFRSDLFSMYKDHIIKINAYSEAAGAFETDALSKSELESFIKLLGDDPGAGIDDDSEPSFVGSQIEEEVDRILKSSASPAKEADYSFEEEKAEEPEPEPEYVEPKPEYVEPEPEYVETEPEYEEPVPAYYENTQIFDEETPEAEEVSLDLPSDEASAPYDGDLDLMGAIAEERAEERVDFEFVPEALGEEIPEEFEAPAIELGEDSDEFGDEGEIENAVDEYDGTVPVNDVFGELDSYNGADFEAVYGEADPFEEEKQEPVPTEEELEERRRRAEDDSYEFYNEADVEFDPLADPDSPTAETGPMFDKVEMEDKERDDHYRRIQGDKPGYRQ